MSFTHDWFSSNIPTWEQHLGHLAGRPIRALEIGCYEGRATRWLLENLLTHADSRITVCDTFEGSMEFGDGPFRVDRTAIEQVFDAEVMVSFPDKVTKRKEASIKTLMTLNLDACIEPFDLIYIDGSHVAKDVMADALLSWHLLKPEGFLIFDDYAWDHYPDPTLTPRLAIDAFLSMFSQDIQVLHKAYQVIVQRHASSVVTARPASPARELNDARGWTCLVRKLTTWARTKAN